MTLKSFKKLITKKYRIKKPVINFEKIKIAELNAIQNCWQCIFNIKNPSFKMMRIAAKKFFKDLIKRV